MKGSFKKVKKIILLETTKKQIWKNFKTTQILSLDIVVFSTAKIGKIQAPQKKLGP